MKTSLLKFLRGDSGESLRLNRKVITFIFCLIASAFFWLVTVLSKKYSTVINVPVTYINIPSDKLIFGDLPETIGIKVKASGYRIALFKAMKKINRVTVDTKEMRRYKNGYYLSTANKVDNISRQLVSEFEVVKIYPDTLFFGLVNRAEKIVPVKLNLEINYEKQFNLSDSIRIFPNAIQVSGASDKIDKIDFVETEKVVIQNAKELISQKVQLVIPSKEITISSSSVNLTVPVAQFTEGNIDLPLEVRNLPNNFSIKTFPDKVNFKFMVAYENFNKINPEMFKAVVDYSKAELNSNLLKVEVKNFPSQYISEKTIKVSPEKVEYIIRKK